ncbi:PucR family transcriptional regulator [Leucobacter soli]|uniref:Transcriptional activator PmfR n=1 Tax=Leucobacter soli TaxID=2812850 RepID=A0A916JVM7_9MICO|nr:PucR family transcriptional regulator [Leucobacter soli]CAG7607430.1 Transcriptional activator PmfR [Leucobacter soli]
MGLTVNELTEISGLRTRFLAGRSGGDRMVLWAHSTDQPNPWEWLGTGDLLLTTGHLLPHDPAEQVRFLTELNRANLAGIALGQHSESPRVSDEALQAADEMGFPFLVTEHSVLWTTVIRIVADSNAQKGHALITKVLRAYDLMRRSYASPQASDGLLEQLGAECGHLLQVLDRRTGRLLLASPDAVPQPVLDHLASTSAALPAFSRISVGDDTAFLLPIAESAHAVMVAKPVSDRAEVDLMLLQHISTIAGIEVERRTAERMSVRTSGTRLLRQLLNGSEDPESLLAQMESFELGEPPWRVLIWPRGAGPTTDDAYDAFTQAKIPALVAFERDENFALVPGAGVEAVSDALGAWPETRVGASMPVGKLGRIDEAVREARWAQEATHDENALVNVYGKDTSPFLPRSITEGEAVVDQVLGEVLAYDRTNDSQLMRSLMAYFDANRSWQEAADALHVHRQTLIYRISKIEKLSGRRMQDVAQQTELYLALQTWLMLNGRRSTSL